MFYKMRRSDRELTKTEVDVILKNGEYGILSTIGVDGYPYGTPVNYVYEDNKIYFHCAMTGHKLDNIQNSTKVSFTVVGKTEVLPEKFSTNYESAIVFGLAKKALDKKQYVLEKIIEKYAPEFQESGMCYIGKAINETAVYEIEIQCATGKARKK